jgi:hypothetical protein
MQQLSQESTYTEDGTFLDVGWTNLFSATPAPMATPALTFEAQTPVSTLEAPTPEGPFRPPIPQNQAAESLPRIAIDPAPRQVSLPYKNNHADLRRSLIRPKFTPNVQECSYGCGYSARKQNCERHEAEHHGKKPESKMWYVCKCKHSISRKDSLRRHLGICRNQHMPGYYVCRCNTQFDILDQFLHHIKECGSRPRGRARPKKQLPSTAAPGAGAVESMG